MDSRWSKNCGNNLSSRLLWKRKSLLSLHYGRWIHTKSSLIKILKNISTIFVALATAKKNQEWRLFLTFSFRFFPRNIDLLVQAEKQPPSHSFAKLVKPGFYKLPASSKYARSFGKGNNIRQNRDFQMF